MTITATTIAAMRQDDNWNLCDIFYESEFDCIRVYFVHQFDTSCHWNLRIALVELR